MPRKTNKIQSHATILLVLEGQTEQFYFSEMRIVERIPGITIIPKMAQHSDLYHVLKNVVLIMVDKSSLGGILRLNAD